MTFIDIHAHVDFYDDKQVKEIVSRCEKAKVIFVNQGSRADKLEKVLKLGEKYPKTAKLALGVYPIDALSLSDKEIDSKIDFIRKNAKKIVAIGEVGLDFHEDKDKSEEEKKKGREKQIKNFKKFIELSKELDKPIIVHSRKAEKETAEILEEMKIKKAIMHCFSGNFKLVQRIIDNKWFLTIPTSVTRSEHFQKVATITPIEQLFCETDTPYLHPDKMQRNNSPDNVIESYKKIAEIKKMNLNDVENKIEESYKNLFVDQI